MKSLFLTAVLAVPVAGLTFGSAAPPPQTARIVRLEKCRIELLQTRILKVGASQTGILEFVEPGEVGKKVEAGMTVARIRDDVMQEKLKAAQKRVESDIEVRYAIASNRVAEEMYKNALQHAGSYSAAEVMERKLEAEKTRLQIEKAKNDRMLAGLEQGEIEAEIRNFEMKAEISGEVAQILKKKGEAVRQGDDIMEIIDISEIRAIGHVPTRYQSLITKGDTVRVRLLPPKEGEPVPFDNVFEGKITFIAPRVSRVDQTFEIYATIRNQIDANGNYILKEGTHTEMAVLVGPEAGAVGAITRPRRLPE